MKTGDGALGPLVSLSWRQRCIDASLEYSPGLSIVARVVVHLSAARECHNGVTKIKRLTGLAA